MVILSGMLVKFAGKNDGFNLGKVSQSIFDVIHVPILVCMEAKVLIGEVELDNIQGDIF